MQTKAIMSSKGQIVIPKHLRKRLGLHQLSELIINVRKDNIIELRPVKKNIESFFGQGRNRVQSVVDINEAIKKAVSENDKY